MKKYILSLLVLLSLFSLVCFADTISVTLNENKIDCLKYGQEPIIENGRTLVPLRAIFEALGADVEWNNNEKSVLSTKDKTTVYLKINDDKLIKNGKEIGLDVPAKIEHGRTLVPVRAVAEAFEIEVNWDSETRTVELFDIHTAVFSKGEIAEDEYKNQYLGLKFTLPDDLEFLSAAEIKSALGYVEEGAESFDLKNEFEKYEFVAADKHGNNVQVIASVNKDLYAVEAEYKKELCGKRFDFQDVGDNQSAAVLDRGMYRIVVVFTYNSTADFEKLLSGFKS